MNLRERELSVTKVAIQEPLNQSMLLRKLTYIETPKIV